MDIRDRFAAHFAAALVDAFPDAEMIARRAYDLAEAMLAERARRIEAEEAALIPPPPVAFLDEPAPLEPEPGWDEDPRWLEPPYDPSWDLEARWIEERPEGASSSRPPGPGLARTQPEAVDERKERSA